MAYTPINWQTGDTITAEKMNKMDNGWGVQESQLFSESVTTEDSGSGMNSGALVYSTLINSASIEVTFNGTDYTCPRIDAFDEYFYGGFSQSGPDFSVFPFALESNPGGGNTIYTQTAGTYTVAVSADGVAVSDDFSEAVNKCIDFDAHLTGVPLQCIPYITSVTDMNAAMTGGKLLYFWTQNNGCFFVSGISGRTITIFPQNSNVTATLDNYGFFYYTES